jgi:heterodisulfide reductase subunit C
MGMSKDKNTSEIEELKKEILDNIQRCWKCRMCVAMCPTHEGWSTQSAAGRLMAINAHLKFNLGSEEELSNLLFACATCRRCQERCRALSTDACPSETIIKARQLLIKRAQTRKDKKHE